MNIRRLSILTFAFVFGFVSMTGFFTASNAEEAKGIMPSDIDGHWMVNTLKDFNKKGYLKGDESGRVFPDKNMSRAEYAAVINRIMQFSEESSKISDFTDVSSNAWYRSDMAKALQAGYMKGTGANTMSPEVAITREQAFVMLYRLTYPKGKEGQKVADISKFSDAATISDYAREAISVLVAAGVISGEFNRLNPKKDISRAQAVLILSKSERKMAEVLKNINEQEFEGTGAGYGGTMKLKVLFDKGKIVDIKIISDNETGSYLSRAKAIIAKIIEKQSVEGIDNISGATLSCNAIKDAVKDCISQQKGEGSIGTVGSTGANRKHGTPLYSGIDLSRYLKKLQDKEYSGSAQGYRGQMNVKVTVKDNVIKNVVIEENSEDVSYLASVKSSILKQFADITSTEKISAVSGATFTRNGLVRAVENAVIAGNIDESSLTMNQRGDLSVAGGQNSELLKMLVSSVEEVKIKAKPIDTGKEVVYKGEIAKRIINTDSGKINFAAKNENGEYIFEPSSKYEIEVKTGPQLKAMNLKLGEYHAPQESEIDSTFKDGTYYGEGYGFSSAERQSKNGDKGFDFPKKNIAKITIARGTVVDAALEFFVDDDDDWKYTGGSERVVDYVKKTPLKKIYEQFNEKKGVGAIVDAVSGSTKSAEGFRKGFKNALEDAKSGKQQKYKGFWLINAPGKFEKHELTTEQKKALAALSDEKEKEKFLADHAYESVPQYFGEKIELLPASIRLIPVNTSLPNPVTKSNRNSVLKLGREIQAKDFDSEGIEVFVTDKNGEKIDITKPINRIDNTNYRANYKIHWKHKESGMELLKEVQFSVKPIYVQIDKIRLVLKNKKSPQEITYQDIVVSHGKNSEFRYEVGIDLAHKELQDIELIKSDGSRVTLKEVGDKHYRGDAHKKSGSLYIDVAQSEKDTLLQENTHNLNAEKMFEFETYRIDYKKDFTNVTEEEQRKIIGIEYITGIKNKVKVGDKFEIGDDFAVKLIAENEDKYSENANKLNYTNYLTITKNGSPLNIGDVITDDPNDAGKQISLKIAYKEDDSVFYEHKITIEAADVSNANNVPDYLEISKDGKKVKITLVKNKARYQLKQEDFQTLGSSLSGINADNIQFYNKSGQAISHTDLKIKRVRVIGGTNIVISINIENFDDMLNGNGELRKLLGEKNDLWISKP